MRAVLDADVLSFALIGHGPAPEADRVIDQVDQPLGPELLRSEVAAALRSRVKMRGLTASEAIAAWSDFERLPITILAPPALHRMALELALELDHRPYDMTYLALAMLTDSDLITGDSMLARKAEIAGWGERTTLVS